MTSFKNTVVVRSEQARWLTLHGYVTIVGHGEIVDDDGKVIKVVLVKEIDND